MYLTVAPCIIRIHYEQSFAPKTVTSCGYNDLLQSNNLIIQKSFCERLCAQRYKAQSPEIKNKAAFLMCFDPRPGKNADSLSKCLTA